jgi:hypothetical protein
MTFFYKAITIPTKPAAPARLNAIAPVACAATALLALEIGVAPDVVAELLPLADVVWLPVVAVLVSCFVVTVLFPPPDVTLVVFSPLLANVVVVFSPLLPFEVVLLAPVGAIGLDVN